MPVGLALTGRPAIALAAITAPRAIQLFVALVRAEPGPAMNRLLGATAGLLLVQSALLTAGVIASA